MTSYELSRLNDKEFEEFAMQLVGVAIGQKVERFKPGKDQGVDGRFFAVGAAEGIVQVKHWNRASVKPLLGYLTKKEVAKVAALKPARYIFVTSVALSRVNKQAIKEAFTPYILAETDVIGNEDIQDFLRDHPSIAQQHYKLWLASSEILGLVNNAAIIGRSAFKMEEILAFQPAPRGLPARRAGDRPGRSRGPRRGVRGLARRGNADRPTGSGRE
jgi:hypothetical protein